MKKSTDVNRNAIIVLGMHRSGTSAMMRVINLCGAEIGENLVPPSKYNERGFWENADILELNEKLLQDLNSSWDDIRSLPDDWWTSDIAERYKREMISLIGREFNNSHFWGVKDPRICRLLPVWQSILEQIGCKPYYLIIVRNPLEVAASLGERNGFPEGKSCLLWLKHMIAAEKGTRNSSRVFVTYEELLNNWKKLLSRVQGSFRIKLPVNLKDASPEIDSFLEQGMRHNKVTDNVLIEDKYLNRWVRDCYLAVKDATDGENGRIVKIFETAEAELEEVDRLYAPVLNEFWERNHLISTTFQEQNQQMEI